MDVEATPPTCSPQNRKRERTRARILAAAERLFASQGFAATRLEDVAEAVGVKRAAIFYHFRDKQSLYDAVMDDAFGDLLGRVAEQLGSDGPVVQRLEACLDAWVDAVGARPSLARFLLREAAGADPEAMRAPGTIGEEFIRQTLELFARGKREGVLHPSRPDPFHVMSAVVGSTVFYVTALRSLLPSVRFDPLEPAELAAHKREVFHMARQLLGYRAPPDSPVPEQ